MAPQKGRYASLQRAFEFAHWAASLPKPPTWQQIQGYLQCTRAAALFWRRAWLRSLNRPLVPRGQATETANADGKRQGTTTSDKE
ncbi:hypothetical protein I5W42_03410 [Stenotrophomonas maltophilia]|nr:hypothetical protein [Stenotrophomonas maltophilia]HEL4296607.1 hypothetical protein [Stenotrophomonas maltophilia]